MKKWKMGQGFIYCSTKQNRKFGTADLKSLGFNTPNFVSVFSTESRLGEHLAKRLNATINKRTALFTILYAENRRDSPVYIGGALSQDLSGSSSQQTLHKKSYFSGTQAGHIAIGTYSVNNKQIGQQGLDFLQQKSHYDNKKTLFPHFASLIAFALALDSGTELVPAYVNQSMGKIETQTLRFMKGLTSLYIPNTHDTLKMQLIAESERMIDFFLYKKPTFIKPIEKRLLDIKHGNATEYTQNPNDKANLMFEGKESKFLEAVLALLTNPASDFYRELDGLTLKNIAINAESLAEHAELAKQELQAS
jgi:hypothetical protein